MFGKRIEKQAGAPDDRIKIAKNHVRHSNTETRQEKAQNESNRTTEIYSHRCTFA
jgi:hypothetical protein